MRVATILARYGTEKYQAAEEQIDAIFERQLPGVERTTIVVDNALPPEFVEQRDVARAVIGGDNSFWEFSAWDTGVQFLGHRIWSYDLVHLVTSAFHTLYVAYLDRFDERMLQYIAGRAACVGHIDAYNEAVDILYFRSQHWIRTSFFFTPPAEIKALRTLVSLRSTDDWLGPEPSVPFAVNAPISENYQRLVLEWLTGSAIGQGSVWHSKIALDAGSWALFKSKATAIFNEHLLGIRLRAQGTRVIDTTWLATKLSSCPFESIDPATSWRVQLVERDNDKVIVGQ